LSKDAAARPQDVETIAKSLEFAEVAAPAAAPAPQLAASVAPKVATAPVVPTLAAPPTQAPPVARTSQPAKKGSPVGLIAVAVIAVLAIAGGAFWFLNREKPEEAQPVAKTQPAATPKETPKETAKATPAQNTAVETTLAPADDGRAERQAQEAAEIARLAARAKKQASPSKPAITSNSKGGGNSLEPSKSTDGFVDLFNKEDLTGWAGEPRLWSVEDEAITGKSGAGASENRFSCLVWQGGQLEDFELHFSYRYKSGMKSPQATAGVEYRAKKMKEFDVRGYEYYLTYSGDNTGFLTGRGREGMISFTQKIIVDSVGGVDRLTKVADLDLTPSTILTVVKKEDWNEAVIIAQGNRLVHTINGKTVADLTDNNEKRQKAGLLAFYLNTSIKPPIVIQLKNIRLKKLSK
jgi:hypothetical protein